MPIDVETFEGNRIIAEAMMDSLAKLGKIEAGVYVYKFVYIAVDEDGLVEYQNGPRLLEELFKDEHKL